MLLEYYSTYLIDELTFFIMAMAVHFDHRVKG